MDQPVKISIITPSLNQKIYIERTIHSVLDQQDGFSVEFIIMDGGSTDGTAEIVQKYQGKLTWVSHPDKGQSDALNQGVAMAKGEIIGWLNSDDLFLPGALERVSRFFEENPSCNWVFGKCRIIDDQDREIRKWMTLYKNLYLKRFSYNALLMENFISQPAVFFRKSAFETAGPLELDLPYAMDYDLWIRLAKKFKPGYIGEYLACFRVHQDAKSKLYSKKQFQEQYAIHKKHDKRKIVLFLHRVSMIRTIVGYWIIDKMNG
ncbi:MAG: glycosyltransferase family 2 protein [Bacteroidota bacterium]